MLKRSAPIQITSRASSPGGVRIAVTVFDASRQTGMARIDIHQPLLRHSVQGTAQPAGHISLFWQPVTARSTPQSSILNGMEPIEDTPSTNNSAPFPAASAAARTAETSDIIPVTVAFCVTNTALIVRSLSVAKIHANSTAGVP